MCGSSVLRVTLEFLTFNCFITDNLRNVYMLVKQCIELCQLDFSSIILNNYNVVTTFDLIT